MYSMSNLAYEFSLNTGSVCCELTVGLKKLLGPNSKTSRNCSLYWRWRGLNRGSVEHFCDCGLLVVWLLVYLLAVLRCVRGLQQHRHQVVP